AIVPNDFGGLPGLLRPPGEDFPPSIHYSTMRVPTVPASRFYEALQPVPNIGTVYSLFEGDFAGRAELRERMASIWRNTWLELMGNDTLNPIWSNPPGGQAKYEVVLRSAFSGETLGGGLMPNYRFNQTMNLPDELVDVGDVVQEFLPDDRIQGVAGAASLFSDRWLARFAGEIESRIPTP
ncbi:hypothetical protein LCGC14_1548490, partial [marine sediment metagenome]